MLPIVIESPRFLSPRASTAGSRPRAFPPTPATSASTTVAGAAPAPAHAQARASAPASASTTTATATVTATIETAGTTAAAAVAAPSAAEQAAAQAALLAQWEYGAASLSSIETLHGASLHAETDNWKFSHESDTHIRVFTRENEDKSARAVCGQSLVKASAARVIAEASNTENWSKWDPLLSACESVALQPVGSDGRPLAMDQHTTYRVYRLRFHKVFPYGARDICYLETKTQLPDGTLVLASKGIDFPAYAQSKDYVRANLKGGGWHARPVSDTECMVTYYMNMDPQLAMVPKWALAQASTRFPGIIDKLRAGIAANP